MKVKVLKVRLSERFQIDDEAVINDYLKNYNVVKMNASLIKTGEEYWSVMVYFEEKKKATLENKFKVEDDSELSPDEKKLYQALKEWRWEKSKQLGWKPFMILYNSALMSVAKFKPASVKEFIEIHGFSEQKTHLYAEEILEILESV